MPLTDIDGARLDDSALYAGKNLIINGAMQVSQRGTSSNVTGYLLDRFKLGASGGTRQVTQESLSSGDPYNEGFRYFHRLTNTGTATGAAQYREIVQHIEAQNLAQSGWNYASSDSYITLSFWVRASVAQTYYVRFQTNDGTAQGYGSAFALSADTWTKVTKTVPGNSNITINNDNGQGLSLFFAPFYGTDFTDSGYTTDTWAAYSASSQLPDMTNTWAGTTNATFDITGVQLEVGASASAFEHRSYGDELRRCQRYYQRIVSDSNSDPIGIGYSEGSTQAKVMIDFPVTMRTPPSSLEQTGTASDYEVRQTTTTNCSSVPQIGPATKNNITIIFYLSGLTDAAANQCRFRIADVYLAWSAEL